MDQNTEIEAVHTVQRSSQLWKHWDKHDTMANQSLRRELSEPQKPWKDQKIDGLEEMEQMDIPREAEMRDRLIPESVALE